MNNKASKVAITGLGAVTSIGLDLNETWENLLKGKSGIKPITLFDTSDSLTKIAAQVPSEFSEISKKCISKRNLRQMTRVGQFCLVSSNEAIKDSKLEIDELNREKVAVIIGATGSGYSSVEAQRKGNYIIRSMVNSLSSWISLKNGFLGPNFTVNTACASSAYAIGLAYDMIKSGQADVVIAGGTESMVSKEGVAGFNELLAISENNDAADKACKPFDKNRDGFVMGEGAGMLVLENMDKAIDRGAHIYCELKGYCATSESYSMVAPKKEGLGMARTMELALANSNVKSDEVDYINAHGTSTYLNDLCETKAIKNVFGERAFNIPISSTKSMIGHTLGAAGALEALVTAKSICEGIITPTINYTEPDPECDLDYVPNEYRESQINVGISNSFGFGGHNCTLVFKKTI